MWITLYRCCARIVNVGMYARWSVSIPWYVNSTGTVRDRIIGVMLVERISDHPEDCTCPRCGDGKVPVHVVDWWGE